MLRHGSCCWCVCVRLCVCVCVCVGGGRTRRDLGNEQHIHLMGLTFNRCTCFAWPTCLKKTTHRRVRKLCAFVCVRVNVPAGGPTDCWLTPFNSHHVQVAGISETRKGLCETPGDLLLIKIPELVELVGLASPVSYHISPFKVHLSLRVRQFPPT